MPPIYLPILLTVTGSALAIFSAIISGFLSSDIEQAISDKEDEVALLHKRLTGAHEHIQRSYQTFNSSDVKLLIVQSSEKKEVPAHVFQEIAKGIIKGIIERHMAAYDDGPSQEKFEEYEAIGIRASRLDQTAFEEFSSISDSLMQAWISNHQKIHGECQAREKELQELKRKLASTRSISVSLQVIGLILVLMKDVFTNVPS